MQYIMKKILSIFAMLTVILGLGMLTGCSNKPSADLVVYGKIYTAEGNQIVEAFAVKDGKYVYVGDKAGAAAFVEEGKTEVVDYSGKGLVMPGCGNGHAHYALGYAIQSVGTVMSRDTDVDKFLKEIVPAAVKKAKDNGATVVFGSGWDMMKFPKDLCYRKMLDQHHPAQEGRSHQRGRHGWQDGSARWRDCARCRRCAHGLCEGTGRYLCAFFPR